jgi:hypothetical protein
VVLVASPGLGSSDSVPMPRIVAHEARGGHRQPQSGQGDARVADDPAGRDLDRLDVEKPASADGLPERHRPHQDVGHARAHHGNVHPQTFLHAKTSWIPRPDAPRHSLSWIRRINHSLPP